MQGFGVEGGRPAEDERPPERPGDAELEALRRTVEQLEQGLETVRTRLEELEGPRLARERKGTP